MWCTIEIEPFIFVRENLITIYVGVARPQKHKRDYAYQNLNTKHYRWTAQEKILSMRKVMRPYRHNTKNCEPNRN